MNVDLERGLGKALEAGAGSKAVAGKHDRITDRLVEAVLGPSGTLESTTRGAILETTRGVLGAGDPPHAVRGYAMKVANHSSTVADADLEQLGMSGLDEEAMFEATIAAALGAALRRRDHAMALLRGAA